MLRKSLYIYSNRYSIAVVRKVYLQNLSRIDKEILKFVLEMGEARYTNLKNYLERNNICSEKTFVAHKKQLQVANLLEKKLSKKTDRPVYVIPSKVKKRVTYFFEKERLKSEVSGFVDSVDSKTKEELVREIKEFKDKLDGLIKRSEAWNETMVFLDKLPLSPEVARLFKKRKE